MILPRHLLDQMIAHAQAQAPLECCGIIATRDGQAVKVFECSNVAESEYRYEIDVVEQMTFTHAIEHARLELGGIYHSHTHAAPVPSATDVRTAFWTDAVYVILGRFSSYQPEPVARAYRISGETWREEPLEITG